MKNLELRRMLLETGVIAVFGLFLMTSGCISGGVEGKYICDKDAEVYILLEKGGKCKISGGPKGTVILEAEWEIKDDQLILKKTSAGRVNYIVGRIEGNKLIIKGSTRSGGSATLVCYKQ